MSICSTKKALHPARPGDRSRNEGYIDPDTEPEVPVQNKTISTNDSPAANIDSAGQPAETGGLRLGTRAQWFRNVQADPHVRVYIRSHRPAPAVARQLLPAEADAVLAAYTARHRRAWNTLKPVVENTLGTSIGDRDTELPMVELHLTRAS